jgi:dienelactone hydrolase
MCSEVCRRLLLTATVAATLLGEGGWPPSAAPLSSLLPVEQASSWSDDPQSTVAADAGLGFPVAEAALPVLGSLLPVEQASAWSDDPQTPIAADAGLGFTVAEAALPVSGEHRTREFTFPSNGQMLHGCMTRPAGAGPFPVVIYNHGSEKDPPPCGPPGLVDAYVERGYLFFMLHRRGHGLSPGPYILERRRTLMQQIANPRQRAERIVALHEEANRDVVAAVKWLMQLPEVDRSRVIMTGVSYGGIQTLFTAEKGLGVRAFVAFAPAAQSWGNEALRRRLERAVRGAQAPIFLAQAENDYSLGPSNVLGPIIRAKGTPNTAKVYPAFGITPQQGHGGFAVRGGVPIWSPDVFAFLEATLEASSGAAGMVGPGLHRR